MATQLGRRWAELELMGANQVLHAKVGELHEAVRRAEAANRAKDEFLANMSHEIRTPLNGVTGVAYVLAATTLDEQQRQLVEIITSSAALLERLLSDVLDMARVEAGEIECRPQPTRTRDLVRAVSGLADAAARAKGLVFEARIGPDVPDVIHVDPARLSQVLINLLNNAVKFTSEGAVRLEVASDGDGVSFAVHDTGIGFEPGMKDRLFERFEQADGSITRRFGGSGLGLAISQRLSQLMGATIDARSSPGEGTVFTLDLPCRPPARAA